MGIYTLEQRVSIIQTYYQNSCSVRRTYQALKTIFGPTETTIYRLVKKFEETGSVLDVKLSVKTRSVRSPQNIEVVRKSVKKIPNLSLNARSKLLGIPSSTLSRILSDDLGLRPVAIEKKLLLKKNGKK